MIAAELIADIIPPLKTSDSVQKAFDRMNEFRVSHLPVVNGSEFVCLISEDDMIEAVEYSTPVGELNLSLRHLFVFESQHVYDVIRLFYEQKLSVVPVLDQMKKYVGMISINTMMEYMATLTSIKEPGGIVVLEISNKSNSLAHIAQIAESGNAQILSSYIQSVPDSTRLEVTLKLNRTDISAIVASFSRYDYSVVATYNDIKNDSTQDRYDQLMNYLDI